MAKGSVNVSAFDRLLGECGLGEQVPSNVLKFNSVRGVEFAADEPAPVAAPSVF
jgi:hypothetical protein